MPAPGVVDAIDDSGDGVVIGRNGGLRCAHRLLEVGRWWNCVVSGE